VRREGAIGGAGERAAGIEDARQELWGTDSYAGDARFVRVSSGASMGNDMFAPRARARERRFIR